MNKLLLSILVVSVYYSTSFAFISTPPTEKAYSFKYRVDEKTLEYSEKASTYEEALEKVSQKCFNDLKGKARVNMNRGLDIIDICVNPRST